MQRKRNTRSSERLQEENEGGAKKDAALVYGAVPSLHYTPVGLLSILDPDEPVIGARFLAKQLRDNCREAILHVKAKGPPVEGYIPNPSLGQKRVDQPLLVTPAWLLEYCTSSILHLCVKYRRRWVSVSKAANILTAAIDRRERLLSKFRALDAHD